MPRRSGSMKLRDSNKIGDSKNWDGLLRSSAKK